MFICFNYSEISDKCLKPFTITTQTLSQGAICRSETKAKCEILLKFITISWRRGGGWNHWRRKMFQTSQCHTLADTERCFSLPGCFWGWPSFKLPAEVYFSVPIKHVSKHIWMKSVGADGHNRSKLDVSSASNSCRMLTIALSPDVQQFSFYSNDIKHFVGFGVLQERRRYRWTDPGESQQLTLFYFCLFLWPGPQAFPTELPQYI